MSQAWNCASLRSAAIRPVCGLPGKGTTLIAGSVCVMRMVRSTDQTASMAAIEARTSWRFNSSPRHLVIGLNSAWSPPPHERKEISLTGVTIGERPVSALITATAAAANSANRFGKSLPKTSRWSGQPKWRRSHSTSTPASSAASSIGLKLVQS